MSVFNLKSNYLPTGDQPKAIAEITDGLKKGLKYQTLLGVTGSGKTFTMANFIQNIGIPVLVISHNKTLAAQLYGEFKNYFPDNAVEYFVSYYDYYQPEAYVPIQDLYIEKDTSINEEIDKLRLRSTSALLERKDVIIVSSVSCIYGLGSPEDYANLHIRLEKGQRIERRKIMESLVDILYVRNDLDFHRGTFRVRGDVIEIFPSYTDTGIRVELFDTEIERISEIDALTGEKIKDKDKAFIYPARHFVTTIPKITKAIEKIKVELEEQLSIFRSENKLLEAQRLEQRTHYDIEMMEELGYCSGIENYSRHLTGRKKGERPYTLIDYFPKDYITIIDESHATLPQVRGMYEGDKSRKKTLVEFGFRLPSALDNRPLHFDEFLSLINQAVFVSATPGDFELEKTNGVYVEQVIRPTGLIDPKIYIRPVTGQIDDLIEEIKKTTDRKERVLVTTLTKRMSEDLADYLSSLGIRVRYMHSEIGTLERVEILRELRLGEFDVLVGINLLREGLDLPEVSLVAILDADKEGFLRSERSLLQTAGRAARNIRGTVILYADVITKSMQKLMDVTDRRRKIQREHNEEHNITPETIYKSVNEVLISTSIADERAQYAVREKSERKYSSEMEKEEIIEQLESEMIKASRNLAFERAAEIRDEIGFLKNDPKFKNKN
ncbi:excinuclease ABC subunit UvrB [candidate division KSB1 bacterium]|nr:excinuclease ABC subunit UvrB [candidate division KSB1 bacterium]